MTITSLLLCMPALGCAPTPVAPQETAPQKAGEGPGYDGKKYAMLGLPTEIVRFIRMPGGGRHPRSVMDENGVLHVAFFRMTEGTASVSEVGDVFYTSSPDEGATFTEPVRLNAQPGGVVLGRGANGPSIVAAGGAVHVLMTGSSNAEPRGPNGEAPLLYVRRPAGAKNFEPQRNLIGSAWGIGVGAGIAADGEGGVHCFWSAPRPDIAEFKGIWYARSTDDGATFADEVAINDTDSGVSMSSSITAIIGSTGRIVASYRGRFSKRRDTRLLFSSDRGVSFDDIVSGYTARKKDPSSGSHLSLGGSGKFLLFSWEENGEAVWSYLLPHKETVAYPMLAKQRPNRIQRNPMATTNRSIAGGMTWMEKVRAAPDETFRIAWQIWDITGRRPIGRGFAPGTCAGSTPSIFVRSDDGFGILY